MTSDQSEAEAATRAFYQAIEEMVVGKGIAKIREAWHHNDRVTSKHPSGDWCTGWDEVCATWELFSSFGRADRGGSQLLSTAVQVYGDVAYATSIFQASPAWGGEKMMCTNILQRVDGTWKVIHHHADPSPGMQKALEAMLAE